MVPQLSTESLVLSSSGYVNWKISWSWVKLPLCFSEKYYLKCGRCVKLWVFPSTTSDNDICKSICNETSSTLERCPYQDSRFFPHLDDIDLRFLHCLLAILTEVASPQRQILFVSASRRCAYIQLWLWQNLDGVQKNIWKSTSEEFYCFHINILPLNCPPPLFSMWLLCRNNLNVKWRDGNKIIWHYLDQAPGGFKSVICLLSLPPLPSTNPGHHFSHLD